MTCGEKMRELMEEGKQNAELFLSSEAVLGQGAI